jgi:hypothetical protein
VAVSALAEHADVADWVVGVGEGCTEIHGTPVGDGEARPVGATDGLVEYEPPHPATRATHTGSATATDRHKW